MSQAEFLTAVRAVGPFEEGDVVEVVTRRRKRKRKAEQLCHPRRASRNPAGNILPGTISRWWFELTRQFKYERLDAGRVRRTRLSNLQVQTFTVEGLDANVARIKALTPHTAPYFGPAASVWWYGGPDSAHGVPFGGEQYGKPSIDAVWDKITELTGDTWAMHRRLNLPRMEARNWLWLRALDVTEARADQIVEPELGAEVWDPDAGEMVVPVIRERLRMVRWRDLTGMTPARRARVLDRSDACDLREELAEYDLDAVVEVKA